MTHLSRSLILGCSLLALTACGPDDVVAPGGPIVVTPTPTAPTPSPTVSPTPSPTVSPSASPSPSPSPSATDSPTPSPTPPPTVTAGASCTGGTIDRGIITLQSGRGTIRNCEIPSLITGTLSLSQKRSEGIMYSLAGRTEVGKDIALAGGAVGTLNITPGVTVFGLIPQSNLIVNRGSVLNADGNQGEPVIFTSRSNIETVLTEVDTNQWGGIILNGRAPVSDCNTSVGSSATGGDANCWRPSEGVSDPRPLYGGATAGDSSGFMEYVQINFSGRAIGSNDEIQGLTMNGVGSGTSIHHIQVHNSSDDGVEIFGGRANLKYLALTGNADDSLDTDNGYQGAIQFVLGVRHGRDGPGGVPDGYEGDTGVAAETLLEVDTSSPDPVDAFPRQYLKLANFTLVQNTPGDSVIRLRGGADVALINGIIVANATPPGSGCFDVDDAATTQTQGSSYVAPTPPGGTTPPASADNGPPILRSVVFDCNPSGAGAESFVFNDASGATEPDTDTLEDATLDNTANANVNTSFTETLLLLVPGSAGYRFANGTNETGVTAEANIKTGTATTTGGTSAVTYGSTFFDQVSYIGAFSGPSDAWADGWTCNSVIAYLRGATNCTDVRIS